MFVHKDGKVRPLDYLNRRKVLCVYVDITVLIWQKVNEAFPSQHFQVKIFKKGTSKTTVSCFNALTAPKSLLLILGAFFIFLVVWITQS